MRILILSANTGGGHNSAAKAIAEQFEKKGIRCEIADCLSYISAKASGFISRGHSYVYRNMPRLFGAGYRFEERHSPNFIRNRCAKGADGLWRKLREGFDCVICVHVFAGLMMAAVQEKYNVHIRVCFVATDYTCSPGVAEIGADLYFIPHKALREEFVQAGISSEKLYACGIPIVRDFYQPLDQIKAKEALGLPTDKKLTLIGGGSMGAGNLEKEATRLFERMPADSALCVLCGNNRNAYDCLLRKSNERFFAVPFTDAMPTYMSAADLYITKPGGLTTTEAIAKRLPMVLVHAVPGCETRNFDFLTENGLACGAKKRRLARDLALKLLSDPNRLEHLKARMSSFMPQQSAERICCRVISLLNEL